MPKVLVVEDDLRVLAMIRQHLQLEGFSVVEASDAKRHGSCSSRSAPRPP
jgi:DNA-binding response OmpR family regulator